MLPYYGQVVVIFTNNVTRQLDRLGIAYTGLTYDYDARHHSAEDVADALGLPQEQVYKTLVVCNPATPRLFALCILPGPQQLNLKAVARHLQVKKMVMATRQQAATWTGMKPGGISPLALVAHECPFLLDEEAYCWDQLVLSAGERGRQVQIGVEDIIQLLQPVLLPLS